MGFQEADVLDCEHIERGVAPLQAAHDLMVEVFVYGILEHYAMPC